MNEFKLERYFAQYEFCTKYMLSSSDCESLVMSELVDQASAHIRNLWDSLRLGYTESQGLPELLELIAAEYQAVQPDQVLVAAPEELIYIAIQALLKPGDEVVVIHPAYQSLSEVARMIGCKVNLWHLHCDGDHWELRMDELEQLLTDKTRLIVVNFPHNPTGFQPNREWQQELVKLAHSHNISLFSDEMYRNLVPVGSDPLPAICDLYERGISLSGLSKAYSAPGLRIGWLASRIPGFIQSCQVWRDYTTICNSAPSEILGCMILEQKDEIIRRNQMLIEQNLNIARTFFCSYKSLFQWIDPIAGPIAFPKWVGSQKVDDFSKEVVERAGVMIVPSSQFGYAESHVRIGLGRVNFREALQVLGKYQNSL